MSREERIRRIVEERAAEGPRAELAALLVEVESVSGVRLALELPPASGVDRLLERSQGAYERLPQTALTDALRQAEEQARLVGHHGTWLIRPGRPERIGLVLVGDVPSAAVLAPLAEWDGEALLIGTDTGTDWIHLDIDRSGPVARGEILVGKSTAG